MKFIDWLRSRCLLGHDWTKWDLTESESTTYLVSTGKEYKGHRYYQIRQCKRCGWKQMKRYDSGNI